MRLPSSDNSPIQSIDYNPNKQYYLMSCHNEAIKFWDIRKQNLPVKVYNDHHAIVLNAKYNHSHDELICCSYDDGTIGLLRMNSVSSTPGQNDDTLVKLYDEHEDSVFSVKWTSFSPWIFTSLSYSAANIVVNFVPSV